MDAALGRLPSCHRQVLQRHLKRLTFLDLEQGAGSALTSKVGHDAGNELFAITLRASLLEETLTEFLNAKEANLFKNDGSGYRIHLDAGDTDALTYVLLHESTHVVDQVLGLTSDATSPFRTGIWESVRQLVPALESSPAARTQFRGAQKIPVADATMHYRALSKTPFVSFYATAAAPEDLAELFA